MTDTQNSLTNTIVRNVFGSVAENIAQILSKKDNFTFNELVTACRNLDVKLKTNVVKKSLSVLLHHGLVHARQREKKAISYSLQWKNCYNLIRWSRFTCLVNQTFGEIAEVMVEELFLVGRATTSELIMSTAERIQDSQEDETDTKSQTDDNQHQVDINRIGQTMARLVASHHIIERVPENFVESDDVTEETKNAAKLRFVLPSNHDAKIATLNREWIGKTREDADQEDGEPQMKKARLDEDAEIHEPQFRVNFDSLEALWRDEIIAQHVEDRTEALCANFMRSFLSRCRSTKPEYRNHWDLVSVQIAEIDMRRNLPTDLAALPASHMDQCIRLLCEDQGVFLMKTTQSASGSVLVCPFQRVWNNLVLKVVESTIQERLGAHAKRAFRLIYAENYCSLAHIESRTMLNSAASRQFVYQLQHQNFIKKVELSKSSDFSHTSAMYLYHVDLQAVARMILRWCYHAMHRLMLRRESQLVSNKRLFDKQERVDALLSSIDDEIANRSGDEDEDADEELQQLQEQREEICKAITPVERQQLERAHNSVQKLSQAEVELDEEIFILERFIQYHMPVVNTAAT